MFGEPGAEIITPDPGFIAYKSMIDYTGAKAIALPHRMENNFSFDADELISLINDKTKLIILNSLPTLQVVSFLKLNLKNLQKDFKNFQKYIFCLTRFTVEFYLITTNIYHL